MKPFLIYILLLLPCTLLQAQTVTNVDARQDGQNIVITFHTNKPIKNINKVNVGFSVNGKKGEYDLVDDKYLTKERINNGTYRCTWNVLKQYDKFVYSNVVFKITTTVGDAINTLLYTSRYPNTLSLNAFYSLNNDFGAVFRYGYKWWYLAGKTNFNFKGWDSEAFADSYCYEKSSEKVTRWSVLTGINWMWRQRFSIYTATGFGVRNYTAEECDDWWRYKIVENSSRGLELECGANYWFGYNFGVTASYSVLNFKYSDFTAGVIFRW